MPLRPEKAGMFSKEICKQLCGGRGGGCRERGRKLSVSEHG